MPITTLSRLLPYLLLAFVGVAAWSMDSPLLLAVVVIGIVGVAYGTSPGGRRSSKGQSPDPGV